MYHLGQNFGSRKLGGLLLKKVWQKKNIGRLAALHVKSARIKITCG